MIVMGSQMGKTAGVLNTMGHKLDDDPAPILYVGPTKSNIDGVIEPQVQQMLRECASLWAKTTRGRKAQKLVKRVAGVTLRLAWAGSPTELASQPAHTVILDEVDRMPPIKGEGDPVTLAGARNATYPDGKLIATSTPTEGSVDVERDPVSKMERWALAASDDVSSAIWRLMQEGTRYEWAVPCPHCGNYFVPRFRLLWWPKGATPRQAMTAARLTCSAGGCEIADSAKDEMNRLGMFVAPGQQVVDGVLIGDPPDTDTASFWVSGLMSPWVSFGKRASEWIKASSSGDQERIRSVLNTGFGEMYRIVGEAPEWSAVRDNCGLPYELGEVPRAAHWLFLTVDVQMDRLVCVVRAWGAEFTSWLVHREELFGDTDRPEVWLKLDRLRATEFDGRAIRAVAVDSGYRTEHVYKWCRKHGSIAYATKGRDDISKLYSASDVAVGKDGKAKKAKKGKGMLKLWSFQHAYFKGSVHDRLVWPMDQAGAWAVPSTIDDDYCKQIVAEQRLRLPSGRTQWITASKDNHYLDCEALQFLLAEIEGVRGLKPIEADTPTPKPARPRRGTRNPGVSIY